MCPLCEGLDQSGDLVYSDDVASVVIHSDWACPGHTMVVSSEHVENLSELTDADMHRFMKIATRVERLLIEETGADRAVLMKLGIAVPHLHLHIYPVTAEMDRGAVMRVINAEVSAGRDEELVRRIRERLGR